MPLANMPLLNFSYLLVGSHAIVTLRNGVGQGCGRLATPEPRSSFTRPQDFPHLGVFFEILVALLLTQGDGG
jgi:hypothetical protein